MKLCLFVLLCLAGVAAKAGEDTVTLREGPGKETVVANCSACHSLDYIPMNSPFLDRAGWEKTINKMVTFLGAPIAEGDKPMILEYLARYYGQ